MEQEVVTMAASDPAAMAFDTLRNEVTGLRSEVTTLRLAIQQLAAAPSKIEIPDYTETLEKVAEQMQATAKQLANWAEKPALRLTPQALSDAIVQAGSATRAEDHAALTKATTAIEKEARAVSGALAGARAATEQRKMLHRTACGGALAGAFLWATCAGFIARSLPESWHLPERMAARTLRLDMWDAGGRLMEAANPDGWHRVVRVAQIGSDNRQTLENCIKTATRRQAGVVCSVTVKPDQPK